MYIESDAYELQQGKYSDDEYEVWDEELQKWIDPSESCYMIQDGGFPFPHEAKAPVTLIQFYDSFDDKYYVIGTEDIEGHEDPRNLDRVKEFNKKHDFPDKTTFLKVSDEKELFKYFFKLIKAKNPAIWTAWNGDLFDFPYIVKRVDNLKLGIHNLSPVQSTKCDYTRKGNSDTYNTTISGIYLLDLMELYKKFVFTPQTSYSLNNIATEELGEEKVEYSEYDNLDELMNGNIYNYKKGGNDNKMDSLYDDIMSIESEMKKRGLYV